MHNSFKIARQMILALMAALSFSTLAGAAEATDFTSADLLAASEAALKSFQTGSPEHAAHLTGFKTWKSGVDAKVKIYVLHGGATMEMNYLCIKSANQIRCNPN